MLTCEEEEDIAGGGGGAVRKDRRGTRVAPSAGT